MKILVLNGPNMNLLGLREPEIYGRETYEDLVSLAEQTCREAGLECICVQSNHEGVLIDEIQKARDGCGGIVLNPAGYSHTSICHSRCPRAVDLPAVEVHISDRKSGSPTVTFPTPAWPAARSSREKGWPATGRPSFI